MVDHFAIIHSFSQPGRTARPPLLPAPLWYRFAPIKTEALTGVGSPSGRVSGHFLLLRCHDHQLLRHHLLKGLVRAGRKAARLGARIIGLAPSMSAFLGDMGAVLARDLGLTLTGGLGYSTIAAIEGLQAAAALMGTSLEGAAVLVLGAAEPLGALCTQILARDGINYITLVDGDNARLDLLSRRVLYDCGVACRVSMRASRAAAEADLVVVAGEPAGRMISPLDPKRGSIVCNLGAGERFSLSIANERPDVMCFDEAVVRLPGEAVLGCDLGLPDACVLAWMAEAIILALEGRYDRYFLGREMRLEKVTGLRRLAAKHGFIISGFMAANRYLSFASVKEIRNNLQEVS